MWTVIISILLFCLFVYLSSYLRPYFGIWNAAVYAILAELLVLAVLKRFGWLAVHLELEPRCPIDFRSLLKIDRSVSDQVLVDGQASQPAVKVLPPIRAPPPVNGTNRIIAAPLLKGQSAITSEPLVDHSSSVNHQPQENHESSVTEEPLTQDAPSANDETTNHGATPVDGEVSANGEAVTKGEQESVVRNTTSQPSTIAAVNPQASSNPAASELPNIATADSEPKSGAEAGGRFAIEPGLKEAARAWLKDQRSRPEKPG